MVTPVFKKRRLHEERADRLSWLARTPAERIAAVESIRLTDRDSEYVKQAFPRVYRVTRKAALKNKAASPRGKDRIDLAELQKVRQSKEGGAGKAAR